MIRELDRSDARELSGYDVCVVGSGPAGAVLATELASRGVRVCVLESGLAAPSARGDRLREVESDGIHVKDWSRERVLGGASTTWAGLSSPLDAIDFEQRPYVAHSGWPIERLELLPYWREAAERYRFAALELFDGGLAGLRARGDLQPTWRALEEKVFLAASEPQDFGRECRATFERESCDLWLDATVLRLSAGASPTRVGGAIARSSAGREVVVRAKAYVIATGGIENARLLLVSRERWPEGLGNAHDQVGRYLMNHPKNYFGTLEFARPVRQLPYFFGALHKGFAGYGGLRLREDEQRARGVLNSYVRLEPIFPWSDHEGVESLVLLVKRSGALFRNWKKKREGEVVDLRDYAETGDDSELQNRRRGALGHLALLPKIALDAPAVASYAYYRARRKAKPPIRVARLRNFMEMAPDPENRVTLAERRDEHGVPLPRAVHRCGELDRRSLIELHAEIARELDRAGFAKLRGDLAGASPWPIDQDASHHIGATRMGRDPRRSVVDPSLRVHGSSNVFVAGASTFPTSGCANPTFTIVALSIRLARHLERELATLADA